ncbi:family 20 glycosylhydrolase [uncultured Roseibium sp.]|uniref:beta-N-acetylhexosaminidase n=1 Tax=uncultured Roseibium sp. TaxID=1936171 RepID=UPI0026120506|nr:family 20 glycosylhydrolase [uncultured Roseibium sp.]
MTDVVLDCFYRPSENLAEARLEFALTNTGKKTLRSFTLAYSAMTRAAGNASLENAQNLTRIANFHELSPPPGLKLEPGESWTFAVQGLVNPARHRLDGPKSAYITIYDQIVEVLCNDLDAPDDADTGERRSVSPGVVDLPIHIVPWPQTINVSAWTDRISAIHLSEGTPDEKAAAGKINDLSKRLFPEAPYPFRFSASSTTCGLALRHDETLADEAYGIEFANEHALLRYGGQQGRDYGLTVLAQIAYGAYVAPDTYRFPVRGSIADSPRFGWRGTHLDVSRHFRQKHEVLRLLDILAWGRMNVLQWHLTDDEGWRLEIKAYPELTSSGAKRGPGCQQVGQLGFSSQTYEGFYSQDDISDIVSHALDLNIDIVPEIDVPGHSTAVLKTYPKFADQAEPDNSYHSIQGYPNNALNPAMDETYDFLEKVFAEVASLFPSEYIHIGGDEVDVHSWLESPKAQRLMSEKNLSGTLELQAHFMGRVREILAKHGKKLAGWDEVSHGGGIDPDGVLLMAWQKREVTKELIDQGYDVVSTPGQHYYLDMVQASGWKEPGASWAGVSTPEASYAYEPSEGLDEAKLDQLKGVQACIWSEHLTDKALFNHMVFPRVYVVAEAGWTSPAQKNWQRFAASSMYFPSL